MKKIFSFKLSVRKYRKTEFFVWVLILTGIFLGVFLCSAPNTQAAPKIDAKVTSNITYISLIPSISEIIYALKLEKNLIGVSSACDYPPEIKQKPKLGTNYWLNKEKILKLKPTYVFALKTSQPFLADLDDFDKTGIKFVYFEFKNVEDIYFAIDKIAQLVGNKSDSDKLIAQIRDGIEKNKSKHPKNILYVIQTQPLITIGSKSFLTDVIEKSGNISATKDILGHYPSILKEYAISLKPDVVVVGPYCDIKDLKILFPTSKLITMTKRQNDMINRPGPRIDEAVRFFSSLP